MGLMYCRDTKKFTHTADDKLDGKKSIITLQVDRPRDWDDNGPLEEFRYIQQEFIKRMNWV